MGMNLWEVLWTKKPCKNFHLLVCVALLDNEKSAIVENKYGFTEILKHINDLSHRIELQPTLSKAEGVYQALLSHPSVPESVNLAPVVKDEQNGRQFCSDTTNFLQPSNPVPIQNRKRSIQNNVRERHGTESSNASCSSLNNSSSVEVLSEMDDEQKFENSLNSGFF